MIKGTLSIRPTRPVIPAFEELFLTIGWIFPLIKIYKMQLPKSKIRNEFKKFVKNPFDLKQKPSFKSMLLKITPSHPHKQFCQKKLQNKYIFFYFHFYSKLEKHFHLVRIWQFMDQPSIDVFKRRWRNNLTKPL